MEEQAVNNQPQQHPVNPAPVNKKPNHWIIALIVLVAFIFISMMFMNNLRLQKQMVPPPPEPPLPPKVTLQPSPSDETANWKTYANKDYGFELKNPGWTEVGTETFGSNFEKSIFTIHFVSGQSTGHEGNTVHASAEVLNIPSQTTFKQWLENSYAIKLRQKGNIDTAYQKGQQWNEDFYAIEQKGGETVFPKDPTTYNEYLLNGIQIYEVGNLYRGGLSYVTFFLRPDNKYVYVLTLEIFLHGTGKIDPPDSYFIETYKQMVKTFKFTDQEDQVACTLDAKLCPDGSYVSRQGPSCEFAACPQK